MASQSTPSEHVLHSFGLKGSPSLLEGGQGTTFGVDNHIVKPVDDAEVSQWMSDLFSELHIDGVRTAKPVRSLAGDWIVEGYICQTLVSGSHDRGRWTDIIDVGTLFHQGLQGISPPPFLEHVDDIFHRADRFAWSEADNIEIANIELGRLIDLLVPHRASNVWLEGTEMPSQLIHGDLLNNVLFGQSLEPAVIDFSPYWRPADYATAIVLADAMSWQGVNLDAAQQALPGFTGRQLLLRAALFRISIDAQWPDLSPEVIAGHSRLTEMLVSEH